MQIKSAIRFIKSYDILYCLAVSFKNIRQSIAVLLIGSLFITSSPPLFGSSTVFLSISASGMIQYSDSTNGKTWMRTVTWADGTSETIQVTEKGRIFLNGREVKAFGYCIAYGGGLVRTFGVPTDAMVETTFRWLQDKGVRFITLSVDDPADEPFKNATKFWMKYCYEHKMFVHYVTAQSRDAFNVDLQFTKFKRMIDTLDGLPQGYADIIYAVNMPSWEINIVSRDPAVLEDYHRQIKPLCKDYLRASRIGDVPLTAKSTHGIFYEHAFPIVRASDIPCWDCYTTDVSDVDWCMDKIKSQTLPRTGKTGYQIWLTEHGCGLYTERGLCSGNIDPGYPPEMFDHLLAQPEVSSIAFYALHYWDGDECNDWGAFFQRTGEPKQWVINLAPHFPR